MYALNTPRSVVDPAAAMVAVGGEPRLDPAGGGRAMVALPGAVSSPRGAALEAWPARRGQGTETAVRGLRPRTAANRSGLLSDVGYKSPENRRIY